MTVARRVALGAGTQIGARVVLMALGLVNFALIARHLGVETFGGYALVVAIVPLLATLVDFGIGTMAVREIARRPEDAARITSTTLTIIGGFAVAGAVLVLAVLPVAPYGADTRGAIAIAMLGLVALLLGSVPGVVFQSAMRLELQAVVDLVSGVANLALVVLVISLGGGLHAIVGAWVGSAIIAAVVGYALALRLMRFRPRLDRPLARLLLRRALPIGLAFVASAIHFRVDTVLLAVLQPIEDVGVYGAAFRFLEHSLLAPLLFMNALFPVLAGYLVRADPRLEGIVQRAFTLLLLLAVPAAVGTILLAEPLIALLAGGGYEDAATPLRILAVAVLFSFVNPLFTNILVASDLLSRMLLATLVAVVVNIALNLVLIPMYTYNGAAAATVVSEAVGVTLVAVYAIRHTRVRLDWGMAGRVCLAAAGMGAVVALLSGLPLAVPVVAGVVVYGALVLALRVVVPHEVRTLLRGQ